MENDLIKSSLKEIELINKRLLILTNAKEITKVEEMRIATLKNELKYYQEQFFKGCAKESKMVITKRAKVLPDFINLKNRSITMEDNGIEYEIDDLTMLNLAYAILSKYDICNDEVEEKINEVADELNGFSK